MSPRKNKTDNSSFNKVKDGKCSKQKLIKQKKESYNSTFSDRNFKNRNNCASKNKKKEITPISTSSKEKVKDGPSLKKAKFLSVTEIPLQPSSITNSSSLSDNIISDSEFITISEASSNLSVKTSPCNNDCEIDSINSELFNHNDVLPSKNSPHCQKARSSSSVSKISVSDTWIPNGNSLEVKKNDKLKSYESTFSNVNVLPEIEINLETDFSDVMELTKLPTNEEDSLNLSIGSDIFTLCPQSNNNENLVSDLENFGCSGSKSCVSLLNSTLNSIIKSKENFICNQLNIKPVIMPADFCYEISDICNFTVDISIIKAANNYVNENLSPSKSRINSLVQSFDIRKEWPNCAVKSTDINPNFLDLHNSQKENYNLQLNSEAESEINITNCNTADIQLNFFDVPDGRSSDKTPEDLPSDLKVDLQHIEQSTHRYIYTLDLNVGANEMCVVESEDLQSDNLNGSSRFKYDLPSKASPKIKKKRRKYAWYPKKRCRKRNVPKSIDLNLESELNSSLADEVYCDTCDEDDMDEPNIALKCHSGVEQLSYIENEPNICNEMTAHNSSPIPVATCTNIGGRTGNTRKKRKRCIWDTKKRRCKRKNSSKAKNRNEPKLENNDVFCDTCDEDEIEEPQLDKNEYLRTTNSDQGQLFSADVSQTPLNIKNCNDNLKINSRETCLLEQPSNSRIGTNSTLEMKNSVLRKNKRLCKSDISDKSPEKKSNKVICNTNEKNEIKESELEKLEYSEAVSNSHSQYFSANISPTPLNAKNCNDNSKLNSNKTCVLEQSSVVDTRHISEMSNSVIRKSKRLLRCKTLDINDKSPEKKPSKVLCNTRDENESKKSKLEKHEYVDTETNSHSQLYTSSNDNPKSNNREACTLEQSSNYSVLDGSGTLETSNSVLKKSKKIHLHKPLATNEKSHKQIISEEFCDTCDKDESKETELENHENLETETNSHSEQCSVNICQTPVSTKNCDNSSKLNGRETSLLKQSRSCNVLDSNSEFETSNLVLRKNKISHQHRTSTINEKSPKKNHNENEDKKKETELEKHENLKTEITNLHSELYSNNVCQTSMNTEKGIDKPKLNSREKSALEQSNRCNVIDSNSALETDNLLLQKSKKSYHNKTAFNIKTPKKLHNENSEFCNTYGKDKINKTELEPHENLETATNSHSEQYSMNVSQIPMNIKNCDDSPKLINNETCVLEQSSSCSVDRNSALETSNSVLKRSLQHKMSTTNKKSSKKIHNEEFCNTCDEGEMKETELENHEVNVFQIAIDTTNCDDNFKLNSEEMCTLEESTNYSAILSNSCSVVLSNIALETSNSVLKKSLRHKTLTINEKSPRKIHNEEFCNTCDEGEIKETEFENHDVNAFQTAINTVNCEDSPKLNSKETYALEESTNCSAFVSGSCSVVDNNNEVEKSNSVLRKSSNSHRHKTSAINEKSPKNIHNKKFCDKGEIKETELENNEVNVFQTTINTVNSNDSPKLNSKETCALEESTNCSAVGSSSCSVVDGNNEVETSISVLVKSKKSHLYKDSTINEMSLKKCHDEEFFDTCDKGKIKRTELENHEVNVSQTPINTTNSDDSFKFKSKKSRRCKTSAIKDKCSEKKSTSTSLNNQPQETSPETDETSSIKKIKLNLSTSVQTIPLSKNVQNEVLPSITKSKKHNKETELNISQLRNFEDSPEKKCLLAALELTSSKIENSVKNTVQDVVKLNKNAPAVSEQINKDLLNDDSSKKLRSSILQKSDLKSYSKISNKRISLIGGNSKQDSSKDCEQSTKSQDLSKQDEGHTTLQNIILPPNVYTLNNTSTIDIIKSMKPIPKLSNRKTDLNKDLHNVPHSEVHHSNMTHSQRDMSNVENEIDEKSRTSTDTSFEALIIMNEDLDYEPDVEIHDQNSFITDEFQIPASSNEKFENKKNEFEESLYSSFDTPQDENSQQYSFYPNNSRLISHKRDLPSEDDSDSDDEYNFKRSRRDKSLEESPKSHVKSSSENSYKDAFVMQQQQFIRCETTTQSFSDDSFRIFSHFSNSPEKPCNQISLQSTENTTNVFGSKNDKTLVGSSKSKVSPGYFLREKDVVNKIREYCDKKLISEAVEIARTYIRISCSDQVNKFIIQELFSSLLQFIDTNNRNIENSTVELFDQILKLIDDYNIYDKQFVSHFIIRCCSYPELNIHSIKMFHSCQNKHIPLNSKAINIFSSFLQSEETSLPVLLDFIQYVKSVCSKKISKELSNLAFKKCKPYKFSDAHRMCLLLHKISSKEIDPLNLQEFLQLCFKNGMWTHITEMFLVCDVRSILSNCIYNALTVDYETMSKYFEKFADSLHGSSSGLSPQHKNLFGVIGTALMVGAYYKCELTCALEILTILHAHNVNYFKLQIQGCAAYLLQNLEDDDKCNKMAFPFLVVFIAIEICLHFKRPRDAYTIFYGFDWVTPDVNLDEPVKAYVIKGRFERLLQLVPLLNVDNSLDEGFNTLNILLSTTEEDLTAEDLKWKIEDLQTVYNEYLISLLNSGKISFVKDLYQHSLGPCKDIFVISPEVLRGLIITFSENKMIEETNALFMLGMIKKIYSIEKPQPESFPWKLTVMSHWTVQEIKLAVEWFLGILLPLLTEKPRKTDFEKWFAMKVIFKTGEQVESKLHCLEESASDKEYILKKVAVALDSMEPSLGFIQENDEFSISIIPDSLYQFRQCRCPNVSPKVASLSNTVQKTDEQRFSFGKELSKKESLLSNQHNSDSSNDLTKQSPISQLQSPHAGFQHSESTENVCELISEIRARISESPVLEYKESASSRPCQTPTDESCPDSFMSPFPRLPESEIRSYDHQQFPQISNLKLIQTSVPSRMDDVYNNKVIDFNSPEYKSLKSQTSYSENKCRQISPIKISPQNCNIKSNTVSHSPKNNAKQERASYKYVSDNQGYSKNMEKISDFDALSNFRVLKTSQENSVSHCNKPSEEIEKINDNLNFLLSTPRLNKSQKRKNKKRVFKLQTPSNAKQEPVLKTSSLKPSNSNNCAVKKVANVKAVRKMKKGNTNCKFNKSEKFKNFIVSLAPNTSVRTFSNSTSQLTNKDNPVISHTVSMAPNTSITVSNTVPQLIQDNKPKTSCGISVCTVPSSDSIPTNEDKPRTSHTVSMVPNISVSTVPNSKAKPTNKNKLKTSHTVSVVPNISVRTISSTDSQQTEVANKNNKCRTSQISKNISGKRLNNNDEGSSIIINVPFKPKHEFKPTESTESIKQLPHCGSTKVIDVSPQPNVSSKSGTDINVPQKCILGVQPKPTKLLIKRNFVSLNKGLFSDTPKFSMPRDAQLSSNTSRQSLEIVKNVQRTTDVINLQPSSLKKESSASKSLLCNVTCNDEELNKIIKFLKIKVTQKHKILTTEEQHQRAVSLAQTFVKSNNVTKMDSKVMKSLTEFAISNV